MVPQRFPPLVAVVVMSFLLMASPLMSSAFVCLTNSALPHHHHHTTTSFPSSSSSSTSLAMVLDAAMEARLEGIRRSYKGLTERLGDPDVLADASLLRQIMSDRSVSEAAVVAYEEYMTYKEELEGAKELFQEAGDDSEMREMARSEMKEIEPKMEDLEKQITLLLLPKDPNDNRNVMLEIRAGTGGSEANIFAGKS